MDIKSVQSRFTQVQSTQGTENVAKEQPIDTKPANPITTQNPPPQLTDSEKQTKLSEMQFSGSLQQAELNSIFDTKVEGGNQPQVVEKGGVFGVIKEAFDRATRGEGYHDGWFGGDAGAGDLSENLGKDSAELKSKS